LILGRPGASLFSEQTVEAPESPFRAKGGQSEAVDIKAEVVDLQSPPLRRFSTADGTFPWDRDGLVCCVSMRDLKLEPEENEQRR